MIVGLRDHTLLSMRLDNIPYSGGEAGGDLPAETEQITDIPCLDTTYYKLKESHIFSNTTHKVSINVPDEVTCRQGSLDVRL